MRKQFAYVTFLMMTTALAQAGGISDTFNDNSVDLTLWETSGNVSVGSGILTVNSGGYIRSQSTFSVLPGQDIVVTFTNVGTSNWEPDNQEMGLYSTDGRQYVKISQNAQNATVLKIKGPAGEAEYVVWKQGVVSARTPYGPELRCPGRCITWQLTVSDDFITMYIDDRYNGSSHIVVATFTNGQVLSSPNSGIVSIPTADLAVEFHGNSIYGNFCMDQVAAVSVAELPFSDSFDGNGYSVNPAFWAGFGNVSIDTGILKVKNKGYVRSLNYVSPTSCSEIMVTFHSVGTESWYDDYHEMGLYSFDGSQYVKFYQGTGNSTILKIKGLAGTAEYVIYDLSLGVPARTACGPELRCLDLGLTWKLVLTEDTIRISIYDGYDGSTVVETFTNGQVLDSPGSGTVSIPTSDLLVMFQSNDTTGSFDVSRIDLIGVDKPLTEPPFFTPDEIVISHSTRITINSTTTGAKIYYTLDGTNPTTMSPMYTGPVTVSGGTTLKAIACADLYSPSMITTMTFRSPTIPILAWNGVPAGMSTPARFSELREAGFTHNLVSYTSLNQIKDALDAAREAGIQLFINPLTSLSLSTFILKFKDHPALAGYNLYDEPGMSKFASIATQVQTIQALDPDHLCYIVLAPNYASSTHLGTSIYGDYVSSFLNQVPVEVLSFDHYPIISETTYRDGFYANLEIISSGAKAKGKPFWAFGLATSHGVYPVPTLAHLRFQMYSNLVYGAQGLQYLTYWTPDWDTFHDGPILADGEQSDVYDLVRSMNQEIKGLSTIFLGSTVVSVGHTGSTLPLGTKRYQPVKPILNLSTPYGGAVVSKLINGSHGYLAVVNRDFKNPMQLNLSVSDFQKMFLVSKDGTSQRLTSSSVQYTVEPGDIKILKWNFTPGDANRDSTVDVGDLGILAANYGTTSGATWDKGDFNGDGAVDVGDLGILAANYGTGSSGAVNFDADYAKIFEMAAQNEDSNMNTDEDSTTNEESDSTLCSGLGLSMIVGFVLMGLMLIKLDKQDVC
jgi:hypothetical protein